MNHPSWPAALLVSCALFALAGCSDVSRSAIDSMRLAWHGQPSITPTPEQVAERPYFQMHATTAKGDAILILGNVDGQRELWYGTHGVIVVIQHGRIVQTVGLEQNLDGSRVAVTADPFLLGLHTLKSPLSYQREDDWSPGYRYGTSVHAALSPAGNADIDILGARHRTLLVTEDVVAHDTGFHAVNRYWVDPADGFVWMSEQHVMPGLTFTLVQLRPYHGTKS